MAKLHHSQSGLLLVRNATQMMIPLHKEITSIGRKLADIILDDPKVSSLHAEIRFENPHFKLVDLDSTNGSFVNRQRVKEATLSDQDVIEIGLTTLCFFQDIRDFHGQVEEVTHSTKSRFQAPTQTTDVAHLTTTTKTIRQTAVRLQVIAGPQAGSEFSFKKSHILIGRSDVDVLLTDMDVSRNHVLIEVLSHKNVYLRDLGSTNGTFMNSEKIQSTRLQSGDQFTLGNTTIKFILDEEGGEE